MRSTTWFIVCGALLGGCFDEGGDEVRTASALATAEGLLAFPEIQNNLTTDPGAAGDALFKFIKTPVAASNLLAPPFDLSGMPSSALSTAAPLAVPACLTTMGPAGCDRFDTNVGTTCEAGGFTFTGWGSRTCSPCTAVEGQCAYDWDLKLKYTADQFGLELATDGPISVTASSITINTVFPNFTLTPTAGQPYTGSLKVVSCGTLTVDPGPPRRLVDSKFVVSELVNGTESGTCALVSFDSQGNPTIGPQCTCP